jgi:hypothetical protein
MFSPTCQPRTAPFAGQRHQEFRAPRARALATGIVIVRAMGRRGKYFTQELYDQSTTLHAVRRSTSRMTTRRWRVRAAPHSIPAEPDLHPDLPQQPTCGMKSLGHVHIQHSVREGSVRLLLGSAADSGALFG